MHLINPATIVRTTFATTLVFLSTLVSVAVTAQAVDNRIFVLGDATEEVVADQVTLNLTLT